jgi:hypothetical protein
MQAESGSRTPRTADASAETTKLPHLHALPHDTGRGINTLGCATGFPGLRRVSRSSVVPAVGGCGASQTPRPSALGAGWEHRITLGFNRSIAHMSSIAQGPRGRQRQQGPGPPVALTETARLDPDPPAQPIYRKSCPNYQSQTLNRPRSRLSLLELSGPIQACLGSSPNQMRRLAKTAGRQ